MFEFTTTTHHPSIQATFIAKELVFTLMWLFEFLSSELKVNISVAQNNFKIAKRISKVWKKERKQCLFFRYWIFH